MCVNQIDRNESTLYLDQNGLACWPTANRGGVVLSPVLARPLTVAPLEGGRGALMIKVRGVKIKAGLYL